MATFPKMEYWVIVSNSLPIFKNCSCTLSAMLFCNSIKVSLEKIGCVFLAPLDSGLLHAAALVSGILVGVIGTEALLCVHTLACALALLHLP